MEHATGGVERMRILVPIFFPGWSEANRARDFKAILDRMNITVFTLPFYNKETTPWDEYDVYYIKLGPPTLRVDFFTDEIMKKTVNHVGSMSESPLPHAHTVVAPNKVYYTMNRENMMKHADHQHNRFEYLRIPFDTQLFYPVKRVYENKDFIIGWAGNKDNWKKNFDIVESLDALPGVTIVCSNGDLKGNGIPNEFMRYYYSMVDCVVQTSTEEGSGTIILEAASCGKPVVAFNVGVAPELLRDNKGGILVEKHYGHPNDEHAQMIRDAVLELSKNRDRAKAMGEENRRFMVEEWNELDKWLLTFSRAANG
jgi:glycosyltransferase involved in cell wall biosynthesis